MNFSLILNEDFEKENSFCLDLNITRMANPANAITHFISLILRASVDLQIIVCRPVEPGKNPFARRSSSDLGHFILEIGESLAELAEMRFGPVKFRLKNITMFVCFFFLTVC